jgi:hypothetical protein
VVSRATQNGGLLADSGVGTAEQQARNPIAGTLASNSTQHYSSNCRARASCFARTCFGDMCDTLPSTLPAHHLILDGQSWSRGFASAAARFEPRADLRQVKIETADRV